MFEDAARKVLEFESEAILRAGGDWERAAAAIRAEPVLRA